MIESISSRAARGDLFASHDFSGIVTRHPSMIRVLEQVAQMAEAEAPVLNRGETGTGKELIARALHVNSSRRRGPFITVNCAALSSTLLESELFGHVSGAFTGAQRERRGRLASAQSGTLLLDEVGEIPHEVQAKLLRFLQFGEVQRVGSDRVERVDTRVLAATNRDLRRMIAEGEFREDLYFRLKVLEIELPPLRSRRSDITLLTQHFLDRCWRRDGEAPRLTPAVLQRIRTYSYPGNVRELAHLVERLCVLARGSEIDLDLLPPELVDAPHEEEVGEAWPTLTAEALKAAKKAAGERVERSFLESLMAYCNGNVSQASRESGIHRTYLYKLLGRHPTLPPS
ncbi:MAG: sigma-54-dependent Fis family transcriptional regulator [bacterium]|nr:sigma-54-dependent Fis family transcriptional regulator [bacterium]